MFWNFCLKMLYQNLMFSQNCVKWKIVVLSIKSRMYAIIYWTNLDTHEDALDHQFYIVWVFDVIFMLSFSFFLCSFNSDQNGRDPELFNLNQDHLSNFWSFIIISDSYKSEVVITSHIGMLKLPNFGIITTSAM